jgi:single-strand DNA-binding protein
MKSQTNSVQLIGRLGKDPEVKNYGEGKTRASFSLATTDSFKNAKGEFSEDTQWHNLVLWGEIAERAKEQLKKGVQISVEGKLRYNAFDGKNGEKKFFTEITVNEFQKVEREQK